MRVVYIFFIIILLSLILFFGLKNSVESLKTKIIQVKKKLSSFPQKTCIIEYPVYYINMDRNPDRRKRIEKELSSINANYTRIKGFNGYKIINTNHDIVDGYEFFNYYPSLTKGEIGCLMAHLIAIQTAWNNGENIVLICEDDTSFFPCPFIPSMTEIVQNAPKDWGIIQLFAGGGPKKQNSKTILYLPRTDEWGCVCYFINRKGMSQILSVVKKNRNMNEFHLIPKIQTDTERIPSRGEADYYLYGIITTYVVSPNLFIQDSIANISTLHTDHSFIHLQAELEAYNNLIKFLS